jgi:peptide/nickel transport system ATP-binding protein
MPATTRLASVAGEAVSSVIQHSSTRTSDPRQPPILDFQNVVKDFPLSTSLLTRGRTPAISAVADVSLTVNTGETFGLVGESGCGKTTLSRLAVGLEPLTSGEIWFEGQNVTRRAARDRLKIARGMQLMFQDPNASLDPRMTVGSSIQEPLDVHRLGTREERRDRVRQLLEEVGLSPAFIDRYPHQFSGGQRQRVGLARTLALSPRLIIADEPVSALDVSVRAQILNLIGTLKERHNLTFVLISHDLSVVRYLADRVGVMYLGKLVEIGSAAVIFDRPAMPYTAGLLSAIPVPDPKLERAKPKSAPSGELPSAARPPSGCRYRTRCPRAQEQCAVEEPQLRPMATGQLAACHFPLEAPAPSGDGRR